MSDWKPVSEFVRGLRAEIQDGSEIVQALGDISQHVAQQVKTRSNWLTTSFKTGRPYDLVDTGQFMDAIRPSGVSMRNGMWHVGVASIEELESQRRPGFSTPNGTSIASGDRSYWRFIEWGLPPNPAYRFIPAGLSPFERKRRKMKVSTDYHTQVASTTTIIERHTKLKPTRMGKSYIVTSPQKGGKITKWTVGSMDGYQAKGPKVYERGNELMQSNFKLRGFMVKNNTGGPGHSGIAPTFLFRRGFEASMHYVQQRITRAVERMMSLSEKRIGA